MWNCYFEPHIILRQLYSTNYTSNCFLRLATQIGEVLKNMNKLYDSLTEKQAEFMMLDHANTRCYWSYMLPRSVQPKIPNMSLPFSGGRRS